MAQEDVELARRYFEAYNSEGLDGTEHLRYPEIEAFDPPDFPDAGRHVGQSSLRELIEGYLEVGWDGVFHDPEYVDAGEEVAVVWEMRGRSTHGGGFPLEATLVHVLKFEQGKLRRIRQFLSREEGLAAAGRPD